MNPFTMVVCIVLIAAVAKVMRERYRALGSQIAPTESLDTQRLRDDVRQMKDRIQVLERVITDNHKSVDLDREIERLRDR